MRRFFLLVSWLFSTELHAAPHVRDFYLKSLLKVQAVNELQNLEQGHLRLESRKAQCDEQLKGRVVPVACYEVLDLEIALGHLRTVARKDLLESLDSFCESAVATERNLDRLKQLSRSSRLSRACHIAVLKILEDREYKKSSVDIEASFKSRHKVGALLE